MTGAQRRPCAVLGLIAVVSVLGLIAVVAVVGGSAAARVPARGTPAPMRSTEFADSAAALREAVAWDAAVDAGLFEITRSWSLAVGSLDDDGAPDFLMGRHGLEARVYRNEGGYFTEFATGVLSGGVDRHDCAWGDVDRDGRDDVFCSLGAEKGVATAKANELWMRTRQGTFVDRAARYGVADPFGRGRETTFLDVNHDPYPDLFVGNAYPRADGRRSPNRLYLNVAGRTFSLMRSRIVREVGAECVQAVDVDGDAWQDLLVCGQRELLMYRNLRGRGFRRVDGELGTLPYATSAWIDDLDGDDRPDLVAVTPHRLRVQLGTARGFGRATLVRRFVAASRVAIGDANGDGRPDVYIVQRCRRGVNQPDSLMLNDGTGTGLVEIPVPQAEQGCGDVAASIDHDLDGMDDFLVLNGKGQVHRAAALGPVQLITLGEPS